MPMHTPQEQEVIDRLVAWGTTHPLIRAMILTSSRARPDGLVDLLSDYDLILAVSDVKPFAFDDAWLAGYDRPMVRWGDQSEMHGLSTYFRGVVYQNHVRSITVSGPWSFWSASRRLIPYPTSWT